MKNRWQSMNCYLTGCKTVASLPYQFSWRSLRHLIWKVTLYPEKTDHETYRAELRTREDERIWIGNNLKLRRTTLGDQVIVNLPATILSKGDYVLTLHSIADEGDQERAGTYYVRVVK